MPRRGGRERFRSGKQAMREVERMRAKYPRLFPKTDGLTSATVSTSVDSAQLRTVDDTSLHCHHGMSWKDCTRCSKPVRKHA